MTTTIHPGLRPQDPARVPDSPILGASTLAVNRAPVGTCLVTGPADDTGYRICGGCGVIHHLSERFQGRGKAIGEHPLHVYAPCGCSQSWYTARIAPVCPCCGIGQMEAGQCGACAEYDSETFDADRCEEEAERV